jgi:iron(III) transport system permease protein
VLGAGTLRRWRDILLPLISRGVASSWIIVFIFVTNEVSVSMILHTPQSQTLSVLIVQSVGQYGLMQAFVFALVQTAFVFAALTVLYWLLSRFARSAVIQVH